MTQTENGGSSTSVHAIVHRPRRHQRSRKKGSRLPDGVVCVTRPGKWGNPFDDANTFRVYLRLAIEGGINPDIRYNPVIERIMDIAKQIDDLRGKDLACWCALDKPCHADVLIEFANRTTEPEKQICNGCKSLDYWSR